MTFLILVVLVLLFYSPTFIAMATDHPRTLAIFILNTLLGWTFAGWVGALIWAVCRPRELTQVVNNIVQRNGR